MKEKELPFLDHLKELRKRLIRSLIAVLVVFLPLIFFSNENIRISFKSFTGFNARQ